jgi:hypothetical protein
MIFTELSIKWVYEEGWAGQYCKILRSIPYGYLRGLSINPKLQASSYPYLKNLGAQLAEE